MSQGAAASAIGNNKFVISECLDINCIKVVLENTSSNLLVKSRIETFLQSCKDECMPHLYSKVVIPYGDNAVFAPGSDADNFIPFDKLLTLDISSLSFSDIHNEDVKQSLYSPWLRIKEKIVGYDYFLSYRWGGDSQLVLAVHDRLNLFPYPSAKVSREVKVFLDNRRLKQGENFRVEFAKSILSSTVVIPFVSFEAMDRMIVDQFSVKEDNVLIEWILALEGLYNAKSNIERIFPVFIGRRDKVTRSLSNISILQDPYYSARPLDRRNIIDCLPDGQSDPLLIASLAKAREMLIANEVEPSSKLDQLTAKKIFHGLGIFLNDLISQKEDTFVKEI